MGARAVIRSMMSVLCVLALNVQASTGRWTLVTQREGVRVYMAHDDDARIKTFRGEARIALDDFSALSAQLDDYAFMASWLHMVSEIAEISREDPLRRQLHVSTRLPWPVENRDITLEMAVSQDPHTYAVDVLFRQSRTPLPARDGYVRMPFMNGCIRFYPLAPPDMAVTYQVTLDPGGHVPAWLANLLLRDIPYFSLRRLGRVVNQPLRDTARQAYFRVPPGWPGGDERGRTVSASRDCPVPSIPR